MGPRPWKPDIELEGALEWGGPEHAVTLAVDSRPGSSGHAAGAGARGAPQRDYLVVQVASAFGVPSLSRKAALDVADGPPAPEARRSTHQQALAAVSPVVPPQRSVVSVVG